MTEESLQPWEQQPGEPDMWYERFFQFYLLAPSYRRSLRGAWILWQTEGNMKSQGRQLPKPWNDKANEWKWVERARAYDQSQRAEALAAAENARVKAASATPDAIATLIEGLSGAISRNQLLAAKELLDRGGVPAVSKQEVTADVTNYTPSADDLRQAFQELDEFEASHPQDSVGDPPPAV